VEEKDDPIRAALSAIDADALSPRDALDQLYRLKQLAAAQQDDWSIIR
jgi:DNA mismatch repair protein MutS